MRTVVEAAGERTVDTTDGVRVDRAGRRLGAGAARPRRRGHAPVGRGRGRGQSPRRCWTSGPPWWTSGTARPVGLSRPARVSSEGIARVRQPSSEGRRAPEVRPDVAEASRQRPGSSLSGRSRPGRAPGVRGAAGRRRAASRGGAPCVAHGRAPRAAGSVGRRRAELSRDYGTGRARPTWFPLRSHGQTEGGRARHAERLLHAVRTGRTLRVRASARTAVRRWWAPGERPGETTSIISLRRRTLAEAEPARTRSPIRPRRTPCPRAPRCWWSGAARTRAAGSCSTTTSPRPGRHPDSDIFLDDVTVSRGTPSSTGRATASPCATSAA